MRFDNSQADQHSRTRRSLLASAGATGVAVLAGCLARNSESSTPPSFTPPSFETTDGSLYTTWIPEQKAANSTIVACSPMASLTTAPRSVITHRLNMLKSADIHYGVDLSGVDHVIQNSFGFRIATGSLDTESLEQTLVEQMPYERVSSYGEFTMYERTDSREQTVALGRETAISSAASEDQLGIIKSLIDTKFGDHPNVLQSDDEFKAVADRIGHAPHSSSFFTPSDSIYDSATLPQQMARVRRLTDEYGYQIHQAAFSDHVDRAEIEQFANELDNNWNAPEGETTYTIEDSSEHRSLRHYLRVSRDAALESTDVPPLPDIAVSVEESADTVTLTHEYGDAVDADKLELEGWSESAGDTASLAMQPSDTYTTFDQGSSLQLSKQFGGGPLQAIYLSYTAGTRPHNLIFTYTPDQK